MVSLQILTGFDAMYDSIFGLHRHCLHVEKRIDYRDDFDCFPFLCNFQDLKFLHWSQYYILATRYKIRNLTPLQ